MTISDSLDPFMSVRSLAEGLRDKAIETHVNQALTRVGRNEPWPGDGPTVPSDPSYLATERARAARMFADVPDIFAPFDEAPTAASLHPMITGFIGTQGALCTPGSVDSTDPTNPSLVFDSADVFANVHTASSYLVGWTGTAAAAFKEQYLDRLESHTAAQFVVARILRAAAEAERAIWKAAAADVRRIIAEGHRTLDALGDMTAQEWAVVFTVLTSVAAVAAVPFSGGASLALTAIGAAAQVVAAVPPMADAGAHVFTGSTAEEIVNGVRRAVDELIEAIADQEKKVADVLQMNIQTIDENWASFVAPRPALADATAGDVTDDRFMGRRGL